MHGGGVGSAEGHNVPGSTISIYCTPIYMHQNAAYISASHSTSCKFWESISILIKHISVMEKNAVHKNAKWIVLFFCILIVFGIMIRLLPLP
jgi:hypothetical protein